MSFDFVVVVHDRDEGEAVKELLIPFLAERGLELSQEKTLITHIDQGFDFLGWNFKKYSVQGKRKMLIKPSKKSVMSIKNTIRETILKDGLGFTQDDLIDTLNSKLRGWSNYHRSAISSHTISYLDAFVFNTLFRWGERRHSKKGRRWIANRYWHRKGQRKWEFCTDEKSPFRICDVKIVRHVKVRNITNPYIDTEYYDSRQRNKKYERGFRDKDFAM